MATKRQTAKAKWVAWLDSYGSPGLFDSIMANLQGAESRCAYCGEPIFCDIIEGGGVPDWGTSDGSRHDGHLMLDYGCSDSPDTDSDGTGGHKPVGVR